MNVRTRPPLLLSCLVWRMIVLAVFSLPLAAEDSVAVARRHWQDGAGDEAVAVLRREVAARPENIEAASVLAQYLGLRGATGEAETLLGHAIFREPGNPDHHLRLALVLRHAGRDVEALAEAERACVLAPDYIDAQQLRDQLQQQIAAKKKPRWRLDLAISGDRYSALRDDEHEVSFTLAYELLPGTAVLLGIDQQHRYDTDDQRYDIGVYAPLGDLTSGWVRLGVSPGNTFLPDHEIEIGVEAQLTTGWQVALRLTDRHYPDEEIIMPRPSLRWDFDQRFGLEVAWLTSLSDQQPTTNSAEARLYWSTGGRLFGHLGYCTGKENNPPLPIGWVDIWSASLSWRLTPRLSLRLDASHEIREDLYTRNGMGLATTVRF